ncbi:tumor necrosis factor receptor superfamily member 16-like [Asterias rubens]|uniref:tumor necrosis factor receptor superfamily member 16-like n=1 Tax=Asterias rubens TaxID=7604 RepID=UPI0014553CCB|nr:tumor necrosis factor receptor superfamily member 16-like [Asterias rubens]
MASHPLFSATYLLVFIATMGLTLHNKDIIVLAQAMGYNYTNCTADEPLHDSNPTLTLSKIVLNYCSKGKYFNYTFLLLNPDNGCTTCPRDTFQDKRNVCPRCKPCTVCADDEVEVSFCLTATNRVCGVLYDNSTVPALPTTWYGDEETTSTTGYKDDGSTTISGSTTEDSGVTTTERPSDPPVVCVRAGDVSDYWALIVALVILDLAYLINLCVTGYLYIR